MGVKYFKIFRGKQIRLRGTPNIPKLTKKGFTVSKVITMGQKTDIETFSPLTRGEARGIARAKGLPFN
jgi:hypothetical protein